MTHTGSQFLDELVAKRREIHRKMYRKTVASETIEAKDNIAPPEPEIIPPPPPDVLPPFPFLPREHPPFDSLPSPIRIRFIQKVVARRFDVTLDEILCRRRQQKIVRPRMIAMYLSKMMTRCSFVEIGRRFGGRDHSTVLHAIRRITYIINGKQDACLAADIEALRNVLLGRSVTE